MSRPTPSAQPARAETVRRLDELPELNRTMDILVLHQHYWPETAATAQILADLCADLAQRGHRVTVLCGQPSYHAADTDLPASERHQNVRIERVWSYRPSKRTIARRLVQYGSYFSTSFTAAALRTRPDVCLVLSTPPLLLGITGMLLEALRGVPFVYSVQDLYPDVAINLGVVRRDGLVARASERVARRTYARAAALITLSTGMAARLEQKGVQSDRIHVIPNWADTERLQPRPRDNPFAREHGLDHGFVVQYSGNLGLSQGLDSVIDAAALLRDTDVRFVLIGNGNAREHLVARAADLALTNLRFLPPQPRERLDQVLSSCSVGLVTMKRGVGDDLVPSKLYGIMAVGRPVLAAVEQHSEIARVIGRHECGYLCAPESGRALAEAILALRNAPEAELVTAGERGAEASRSHYSRRSSTRAYERVFASVARAAHRPA